TYTCLLYMTKEKNKHLRFIQLPELKEGAIKRYLSKVKETDFSLIDYESLSVDKWVLSSDSSIDLLEKLSSNKKIKNLDYFFKGVVQGIVTGNDDTHLLGFVKDLKGGMVECHSPALGKNIQIEKGLVRKCLTG